MDALAWIVLACMAAAVVRALLPTVAPAMQAHVAALGHLFGGWRPPAWPRGVQEDDPETAWAKHGRAPGAMPAGPQLAGAPAGAPAESPAVASIEYLD